MLLLLIICSFCTLSLVDAKTPLLSSVTSSTRSALKPSLVHQKSSNIDGSTNNSVPTSSSNGLTHIPSFLQRRKRVTSYSSSSESTLSTSNINLQKDSIDFEWSISTGQLVTSIRGGDTSDLSDDESSDDEYDSEELSDDEYDGGYDETTDSDEDNDEYYDSESEEEEDEEDAVTTSHKSTSLKSSIKSKSSKNEQGPIAYDDLLTPPAMQQVFISVGVMLLSNKIDITDPKPVRIARFAFVTYIITVQVFLAYVYLRAKSINDRTPITISNPLASLVQQQGGGGTGTNFMVKALTDQILSTQTTILEYDLKQAKKMNGGLLFPMIMLYFLHFKMKQVQPLLMQTATGVMNLVYSPLFQVYVLGRNLERPFKPPVNPMMDALQKQQQQEEEEQEQVERQEEETAAEDGGDEQDVDEEEDGENEDANGGEDEKSDEDEYDSDDE